MYSINFIFFQTKSVGMIGNFRPGLVFLQFMHQVLVLCALLAGSTATASYEKGDRIQGPHSADYYSLLDDVSYLVFQQMFMLARGLGDLDVEISSHVSKLPRSIHVCRL